jgi:hypothetical protein
VPSPPIDVLQWHERKKFQSRRCLACVPSSLEL